MLTPIKVSEGTNCYTRQQSLLYNSGTDGIDNENTSSIMELTKSTFYDSTDYRVVYKNFDYKKPYDCWIYEGNDKDKIVGYKYLQSYPYDTPQFKIGDYIHWNFNHKEYTTWLLISLDTQYLYNVKGRMLQCNNSLRWKDKDGNLNCYPCVIEDSLTYTNFKWGNKGVVESGGDIVVVVQRNEYTSKIRVNDRFLFNQLGFKVKQIFNELNPNYLELYMMKVPELTGDNLNDNIAINDDPIINTELNGIVLLPDTKEILLGETISFSVYDYVNGEKQNNGFLVYVENVPAKCYEFNKIDENNFTITNIMEYDINPLNIRCVDNNGNEINKKIWLGGNW